MNPWKNSIFRRLLLTFISIMIPIYLFGLFIYNWGINTVRDEISSSIDAQVTSYLGNLDAEIQRIQSSQYNALSDENLYTLAVISATMNDFERRSAILRLQQRLNAIKTSSIYLDNVMAYIPQIGKMVSANDGPLEEFSSEIMHVIAAPANVHSSLIYWEGKLYLVSKYPGLVHYSDQASISYAIVAELSNSGIQKALAQLDNQAYGTVLIDRGHNFTYSENDDRGINERIRNEVLKRNSDSDNGHFSITLDGKTYMVIMKQSDKLDVVLTKYIPEEEIFAKLNKYRMWIWIYTVITVAIILIFCISIYKFIHKPLVKLVKAFKKMELGDLNIQIEHSHQDEFRYLFQRFNVMVDNLNALIDQVYKQKIMAQTAEMKQLQSQINPHFLYNSFFILHGMVETGEYDTLKMFTKQLGHYFQFVTRNSRNDIPLQQEVIHARTYAQIQSMRFGNRISLDFSELPEAYHQVYVPRLILQPIIENVYEHGLENKVSGGLLRIHFQASGSCLLIVVEDNGEELTRDGLDMIANRLADTEDDVERTGIINIHKRIQLTFGPDSGVTLSQSELGGLKVELRIQVGEGFAHVPIIDRG